MATKEPPRLPDELASLYMDARRRAQLQEVLEYVASLVREHRIEPLRFCIDPADVERWRAIVKRARFEITLRLSVTDLHHLEEMVEAAGTHASRGDLGGLTGLEPGECSELSEWLSKSAGSLFHQNGRVH